MPVNLSVTLGEVVETGDEVREAGVGVAEEEQRVEARRPGWVRGLEAAMLGVAAVFFALHFVHLRADFPNNFFWRDWAKYTDEGWYGAAAVRLYQMGHWYLPGDFNPGVALPVWPALEAVLFRFTGVSLVAARALAVGCFGLTLVASYALMRRWTGARAAGGDLQAGERGWSLAPAMVVLLLAVSPFFYAFSRLAIMEPLLILLMVAALLAATKAGEAGARAEAVGLGSDRRGWEWTGVVWAVVLGALLPVMVLTKTTAVALFPAVFWMVWEACGRRVRVFVRVAGLAAAVGAVLWAAYYVGLVRPHYLVDYRYLFSANANTGITAATAETVFYDTLFDGIWMGKVLFAVMAMAALGATATAIGRRLRGNPLPVVLLLWALGYGTFVLVHANPQPRYYLVIALPLTMLAAAVFEPLMVDAVRSLGGRDAVFGEAPTAAQDRMLLRAMAGLAGAGLLFVAGHGAEQTLELAMHPEYTWVNAAAKLAETVRSYSATHPGHPETVLSISGADLSLMTGLPTICDDYGTLPLPERIVRYRPGWFATWNEVEDDKMEALTPDYRLVRVGAYPAFDDDERNVLILYRLDRTNAPLEAAPVTQLPWALRWHQLSKDP